MYFKSLEVKLYIYVSFFLINIEHSTYDMKIDVFYINCDSNLKKIFAVVGLIEIYKYSAKQIYEYVEICIKICQC